MKMPFGKHKGEDLQDVPEDYLLWLLDAMPDLFPGTRRAIERELGERKADRDFNNAKNRTGSGWGGTGKTNGASTYASLVMDAAEKQMLDELIQAGFRAMAMRYHPDRPGGNAEKMKLLNGLMDRLKVQKVGA